MSEQTSAAQSAPAGEREAFEAKYEQAKAVAFDAEHNRYVPRHDSQWQRQCAEAMTPAWRAFQAGAAWQRAQGAVPEAKVTGAWESARIGDFNAGWNACRDSVFTLMKKAAYMELDTTKRSIAIQDELRDQLAAAPSQPAVRAEENYSTTSDRYRAELYDEVWQRARDMGYGNVTMALEDLAAFRANAHAEAEALREKAGKYATIERVMKMLECDERDGGVWTACTLLLISSAHKMNSAKSVVEQEGVTVAGEQIGNWRVTVERIVAALAASTGQEVES